MEHYPPELTSPPVPLVALIGMPELHLLIGDYLRTQHQPRILSIGLPDPLQAPAKFGGEKKGPGGVPRTTVGILKSGWVSKHRSNRPAVNVLLLGRQYMTNDPSGWMRLMPQLEAVKAAGRSHGIRLLVAVAQREGEGPIPEDWVTMISKQAGIDKKKLLTFDPGRGPTALAPLGRAVHELCTAYYSAAAQRRLGDHAGKVGVLAPADNSLRVGFKLGVLAEFRGDWETAVRMYREAYNYVPQALLTSSSLPPYQRYAEIRAVAEYVHVKLVSVLLLALQSGEEAAEQLSRHLATLRHPPFNIVPPGLLGSHHAWVSRQYAVLAELLASSGVDLSTLKREHQPGELYLCAARAAIKRRQVAEFIRGLHGPEGPPPLPGHVVSGKFVGQVELAEPSRPLTDDEFISHLEALELRFPHSRNAVALLRASHEALLRGAGATGRAQLRHVSTLLGQELMEGGELGEARAMLDDVAASYRRSGWLGPLHSALLLLRECSQRQGHIREHAAYSLEASAVEGQLEPGQRAAIAGAALMTLLDPPPEVLAQGRAGGGDAAGPAGLHYVAREEMAGWGNVVHLAAGFLEPEGVVEGADAGESAREICPKSAYFGVAVWNHLPVDIPLAGAELQAQDAMGAFCTPLLDFSACQLSAGKKDGTGSPGGAQGDGGEDPPPPSTPPPTLLPGGWRRLVATVPMRCSGAVTTTGVKLALGPHASVLFPLSSEDAGRPKAPPSALSVLPPFPTSSGFRPGQYTHTVPPRHTPPVFAISGPQAALEGEAVGVRLVVGPEGKFPIRGARLVVKALHRPSNQYCTLRLVGAHQQGSAGAAQQAQQGVDEGLDIGDVAGGAVHAVMLEVLAPQPVGELDIRAQLQYSCQLEGGEEVEAGKAYTAARVPILKPFKFDLQLAGPPLTHTLLQRPPQRGNAAPGSVGEAMGKLQELSTNDSFADVATTATSAPPPATPATHPGPLSQGAALLGKGRGEAWGEGGGTAHGEAVLPAGLMCTAVVTLKNLAPCEVELLSVDLQPPPETPPHPHPPLSISPALSPRPSADREESAARDNTLHQGDTYASLFTLSSPTPGIAPSLGQLVLRWRRTHAPAQQWQGGRGGKKAGGGGALPLSESWMQMGSEGGDAPAVQKTVTALPAGTFLAPHLTATLRYDPRATAGAPLSCTLRLQNGGQGPLDVKASLKEVHGFVVAGPKSTTVQLLPGIADALSWQFVPTHPGSLKLPSIAVEAPGLGHSILISKGCTVLVDRQLGARD